MSRRVVIALLLCACAAAPKGQSAEPNAAAKVAQTPPRDFRALLARDVAALPVQPFESKQAALRGAIEAKSPPEVSFKDGYVQVAAPIGADTAVVCMVYDGDLRPGVALSTLFSKVFESGARELERVGIDSVEAFAGAAAIYATALYRSSKGDNAAGTLKVFLHAGFERGVMCLHDEVGYRRAFARVSRGFVERLEYEKKIGATRLLEVVKLSLGQQTVGVFQTLVAVAKGGETVAVSSTSRFLPISPTELATSDSIAIEGLDREHRIEHASYGAHEGADESLSLELSRGERGRYQYKGTQHGEPLAGDFTTKDKKGLLAGVGRDERIAEAFRAKRGLVLDIEEYSPVSDPTKTELLRASVDVAKRRLSIQVADVAIDERVDEQGFASDGEIQIGKQTLRLERLLRNGSL
ncbi:MAG: hypothetical protein QM756_35050 [Polyangiaceae bacterium]